MKHFLFVLLLVSFSVNVSFSQIPSFKQGRAVLIPFQQNELAIEVELEKKSAFENTYALSWNCPLINSQRGKYKDKELHLFVRSKEELLAFYSGDTLRRKTLEFETQGKEVFLFFQMRDKIRYFPKQKRVVKDGLAMEVIQPQLMISLLSNCDESEFKKVKLSLEKEGAFPFLLQNNEAIVFMFYINKNAMIPNEMPKMGCQYDRTLCLTRFYLNADTGRILKGQQWLNRKGIRRLCEARIPLYPIDPQQIIKDDNGNIFLAKALIKKRKIDLSKYTKGQLYGLSSYYPY